MLFSSRHDINLLYSVIFPRLMLPNSIKNQINIASLENTSALPSSDYSWLDSSSSPTNFTEHARPSLYLLRSNREATQLKLEIKMHNKSILMITPTTEQTITTVQILTTLKSTFYLKITMHIL